MNQKVSIGSEFEAKNGSLAKVVTFISEGRAIVRTSHPLSANDLSYEKVVSLGNLQSGRFRSVDTPNKFGCYIGCGVYNTSHKRVYNAHNNTQKYAFRNGRKLQGAWHDLQNFGAWFVSNPHHLDGDWILNYTLLLDRDCKIGPESTCLLPREVVNGLHIKKQSRIAKKTASGYRIDDPVNFDLADNILLVSKDAAISIYCHLKEERVKRLAEQYKFQLPENVYQALLCWKCCVEMN